ncbi:MAG: ATP-binding protein [Propionibacteriaceae bacterium]|jgi:predicted AAA+ superfamily ATPase|nr:ATP-binding protein [Propionibacteriaceae bacterium]
MELVDRPDYLARLRRWRDRPVIKVVTGVRRCGKSTLLELYRRELAGEGVPAERIIALNLEDLSLGALTASHQALHDHIAARLAPDGPTYVFLDEVQAVPNFERAIASLQLRPGVDLYVTGSNAHILSGDLATLLSGRYVEVAVLPLSLAEFAAARRAVSPQAAPADLYADYVRFGSFPFVLSLVPDGDAVDDYLGGLLATVLLKDVAVRQKVANARLLQDVTAYLFHNVGSPVSLRRVSDSLTSLGRRPSPHTVESYLTGLIDAYLVYPVAPWDVRGLTHLAIPDKYYVVDPGLRRALVGYAGGDSGHVLENVVFLELRRRHSRVRVGRTGGREIDFVVGQAERTGYFQVAQSVRDPATLERELAPLRAIDDHHPKRLLTLDAEPPISHNGIVQLNVLDWLLGRES